MILSNCRVTCSRTLLPCREVFSTHLFRFLIDKKLNLTARPLSKNLSASKKKFIESILKSEISPFIDETKIHLIAPLLNSCKNYKIFYRCVLNYSVARDIVDKILPHFAITEDIVVEANPGLGFITLCLIDSHVQEITVLDKTEIVDITMNRLKERLPKGTLDVIKVNLFKFPGIQITNLIENSIRSNSTTKVIGVISNNTFLINLIHTYIVNDLWDAMHHLEFYLVVGSTVWNTIINFHSSESKYKYHSLFGFMFKFEELGKYSTNAFYPPVSNDKNSVTLVKITANLELLNRIERSHVNYYLLFIEVLSRTRQTFIIPTLEKFAPNCGPYLISKGVSMSNTLRDFSHSESVILFNLFKECEGFDIFKSFCADSSQSYQFEMEETK